MISLPLLHVVLVTLLHEKATAVTKLVTFPPILYVYAEDSVAMVECYNGTLNDTSNGTDYYNPISNAWWYKQFPNGTQYQITATKPPAVVFVQKYVLTFYPKVRRFDQGQYFCCLPGGRDPGGNGCSELVNVSIAVPPDIQVVRTNYTGYVGYNVTLLCKIANMGTPPALFRWKKHRRYLPNDLVMNNDTHTALTLTNVTKSDEAEYKCVVDGVLRLKQYSVYLHVEAPPKISTVGPRTVPVGKTVQLTCSLLEGSLPNFHIITPLGKTIQGSQYNFTTSFSDTGHYQCVGKLNVSEIILTESHYLYVYDINNTTSSISFLVIVRDDDCKFVKTGSFERRLLDALKQNIFELCDCSVSLTSERFQCAGDNTAYLDVNVDGFMAGNIKEFLENSQLTTQLDLQIATLYVCDDRSCRSTTNNVTNNVTITPQGDDDKHPESQNVSITAILFSLSVLTLVVICLIVVVVLNRWMCSNKGGGCMMCNCTIQHKPPTPTKSGTQFLCKEHTNVMLPNKDNLSVPTELHITTSISSFPSSPSSMTMNTACELKEAEHYSNFTAVDSSRDLSIVSAPPVVDKQVLQCCTSLFEGDSNLKIDYGLSKHRQDNEGTKMSYIENIAELNNSFMNTMQIINQSQEMQSGDVTELLNPVNQQTYVNSVRRQHCETSV